MPQKRKLGRSNRYSKLVRERMVRVNVRLGILCKPAETPTDVGMTPVIEAPPDPRERQAEVERLLGLKPGELDEERVRLRLRAAMDIMLRSMTDSQGRGEKL